MVALEAEVSDLSGRLDARKLVDRAKALLQAGHGMSEPDAFRWIQRTSMDERRTMRAVAEDVLAGRAAPSTLTGRADQITTRQRAARAGQECGGSCRTVGPSRPAARARAPGPLL